MFLSLKSKVQVNYFAQISLMINIITRPLVIETLNCIAHYTQLELLRSQKLYNVYIDFRFQSVSVKATMLKKEIHQI